MHEHDYVTIFGYASIGYIIWRLFSNFVLSFISRTWCRFTNYQVNLAEKFGPWAVITGSTDGIGKAYAKELAKRGISVVLISRSREKLEITAQEISTEYNVPVKIIVANFADGLPIYERIKNELDGLEVGILVNNVATASPPAFFYECSSQSLWDDVNVNVNSSVQMTSIVLPQMKKRKKGAIVNVASYLDGTAMPLFSLYTASKSYIRSFSLALQYECSTFGVTVQVLSPAFVKTKMHGFSDLCQKQPAFTMPTPQTYCKQAVDVLGIDNDTTGCLHHEILYALLKLTPVRCKLFLCWVFALILRQEQLKKKSNT